MATRSQPKLLVQGKPRTLGGGTRPWRVRLYAPAPDSNKYQVYFKAPAGEGEPSKRVLRANSEAQAHKILARPRLRWTPTRRRPSAPTYVPRAAIRTLGEEYLKDSTERGEQPWRKRLWRRSLCRTGSRRPSSTCSPSQSVAGPLDPSGP